MHGLGTSSLETSELHGCFEGSVPGSSGVYKVSHEFQALSSLLLKESIEGASTTSFGRLFQRFTARWLKKYFLKLSLECDFCSFRLCPLVFCSSSSYLSRIFIAVSYPPVRYLYVSIMSPRWRRWYNVGSLSLFKRSGYGRSFNSGIIFVAWCCTFSSSSIRPAWCRDQTKWPYSRRGRTCPFIGLISYLGSSVQMISGSCRGACLPLLLPGICVSWNPGWSRHRFWDPSPLQRSWVGLR